MKQTSGWPDRRHSEIHRSLLIERSKRYPPYNPISPNTCDVTLISTVGYPRAPINLALTANGDRRSFRQFCCQNCEINVVPEAYALGLGERWRVAATSSAPASLSISVSDRGRKSHGSPICARRRACARRRPKQRPELLSGCLFGPVHPAGNLAKTGGSNCKSRGRRAFRPSRPGRIQGRPASPGRRSTPRP